MIRPLSRKRFAASRNATNVALVLIENISS